MDKLSPGCTTSPQPHRLDTSYLGPMKSCHECRQDVAGIWIEVIMGSVGTIWNHRNESGFAILFVVGQAQVGPSHLRNSIGQTRWLRSTGEEYLFCHRLGTFPRIHTGRTEEN